MVVVLRFMSCHRSSGRRVMRFMYHSMVGRLGRLGRLGRSLPPAAVVPCWLAIGVC